MSHLHGDVGLEEEVRLDVHPVHLGGAGRAGRARRQVVGPHHVRVVPVRLIHLHGNQTCDHLIPRYNLKSDTQLSLFLPRQSYFSCRVTHMVMEQFFC